MLLAVILCVSLFSALTPVRQAAAVNTTVTTPGTFNFQGRLSGAGGAAVVDGQYNMTFRLMTAATGGTAVWTEVRDTTNRVTVTNGLFSVQLGAVTPISQSVIANQADLWLEVELPSPATATCSTAGCASYTEGPMTPRSKLASSAYAMNADLLDGFDSSAFGLLSADNTFTGSNTFASGKTTYFNGGTVFATGRSVYFNGSNNFVGSSLFSGSVQLKPTAGNDGTAFDIQNSGGSDLFAVDTSASVVRVGSATDDATGVVLVLDSKNTSGDPTGYNGAMYYNSSTGKFRCYQAGAWANCIDSQTPVAKTADYTAKDGDFVVGDATAGSFTVTLPAPAPGAKVSVKKVDATGNAIFVVPPAGGHIDNLTSDSITVQWYSQDYYSDGTTWYRV